MARGNASAAGFTLVEVLIAMAITALISVVAYTGLSSALSGAESLRSASGRAHDINQTLALLSRDLRQVVNRPVVDEFGQVVPALWAARWHGSRYHSPGPAGTTPAPRREALCSAFAGGLKMNVYGAAIFLCSIALRGRNPLKPRFWRALSVLSSSSYPPYRRWRAIAMMSLTVANGGTAGSLICLNRGKCPRHRLP